MSDQLPVSQPIVFPDRTMEYPFRDYLGRLRTAIDANVVAGYGGIELSAPAAQPDIGVTWNTLVGFDGGALLAPKFVTQDFASDGLRFEREGTWQASVAVSLEHNASGPVRRLQARLFNMTTATPGARVLQFATASNIGVTQLSAPAILQDLPFARVGDLFVIQIASAADAYTSVNCIGADFSATHVSEQ